MAIGEVKIGAALATVSFSITTDLLAPAFEFKSVGTAVMVTKPSPSVLKFVPVRAIVVVGTDNDVDPRETLFPEAPVKVTVTDPASVPLGTVAVMVATVVDNAAIAALT